MKKFKNILSIIFFCRILKFHDWTCANKKGIKPTDEQLQSGIKGFWDYAKMYCDRCGHVSELSKREILKHS